MTTLSNPQLLDLSNVAKNLMRNVTEDSKPRSPQIHIVNGANKTQLLVVNGTRIYEISSEIETRLSELLALKDEIGISNELVTLGLDTPIIIDDVPLKSPPLYAISLAIAQKCNMGCGYCYAEQGDFGGGMKNMPLETAIQSIDLLLKDCPSGRNAQVTFLGGEPLSNRSTIRAATEYAYQKANKNQVKVNFSITTNGTLLTEEDALFFEKYGFSVTVSLDGLKDQHNILRPLKNGTGTFDLIMERIKPLLAIQQKMQVSARVTITPTNVNLVETLNSFISMGFHSVGFSPLLRASNGKGEMTHDDLNTMLKQMIACGLTFEQQTLAGKRYPFLNMVNALKEIAKGTHRPYPCGAGAGYMGVSSDGDLAACHRFVNEPAGNMGNINSGIDTSLQNNWLASRHVHTQVPCNQCWARYLCGGGCHHEVLDKGRNACDYIRGWLHYTIQAHNRMSRIKPDWNM